jgi:hypothetical protein
MFEADQLRTVGSAVERLGSVDLGELSDAAVQEGFEELHRASEALEVQRLRWLAELDRRRPCLRDGYLSTSSWVAHRLRVGWPGASRDVGSARALRDMPGAREALGAGDISLPAARVLMRAREVDPEAHAGSEGLLVEAARRHDLADLQRAVASWRTAALDRARQAEGDGGRCPAPGPRGSAGPTPWGRSAGGSWTPRTGPRWEGSVPTSP